MTPDKPLKEPDHDLADHPVHPLVPGCWLNHLLFFCLSFNCYHALRHELGVTFTVGELVEKYGTDYTQIRGVGRVYAAELATVIAVFYDTSRAQAS